LTLAASKLVHSTSAADSNEAPDCSASWSAKNVPNCGAKISTADPLAVVKLATARRPVKVVLSIARSLLQNARIGPRGLQSATARREQGRTH
jgi:hypothetical protein